MSYVEENSKIWDERSENNDIWSVPVTKEMVQNAKEGNWSILLTPTKPVPKEWFSHSLRISIFATISFLVILITPFLN